MSIPRHHSTKKEWAQYMLLGLPTAIWMAYAIFLANQWLAVLSNNWIWQSIAFATGLGLAIYSFARRLRFITLTLVCLGLMAGIKWAAQFISPEEFDAFFFVISANNYFTLFLAGWIAGYGFSRSRFFTIFWAVLVLAVLLVVIASITAPMRKALIIPTVPVLVYVAYIIYTGEFIRNMNEDQSGFKWFVARKIIAFGILMTLVISIALQMLKPEWNTIEKEWENGGKPKEKNERQNSLTRNDGQGTSTQTSMGLQGFNNRANKDSLLFVAKLDNYFEDGITPNPLYFISDYFTLFDSLTQTFEIDTLRPYNDLFKPNLTALPLYFPLEDTGVLSKSMSYLNRKVADAEIYKTQLSPRHFTAPSTAFFVQPISVPEENKDIYKSAYRTKMLVSDLNSAYFVYNPSGDEGLAFFQEQRFAALRSIPDYNEAPADFMSYYTQMPIGNDYDSIRLLADTIIKHANAITPVDKIIAIRNYFMQADSTGTPLFRYSDNPGIPGIPSANRLCHFLFESKKGYCAYYAGATLFLLRSLGIPSRIATGFLTVDRSNKNPGWYWFYEDQAHAWVQAWFPGFGWLDFDTTIPDSESRESPQPDQTPPLTSQTAWLVANGKLLDVDTLTRIANMRVSKLLYWDNPVNLPGLVPVTMDVKLATILRDTGRVALSELKPGMEIVAVSFSEQFKELPPVPGEKWSALSQRWPNPIPIDEIKIIAPEPEKNTGENKEQKTVVPWMTIAWWGLILLLIAGLIAISIPYAIYTWLAARARYAGTLTSKAYYSYMASLFYLNQLGIKKHKVTPQQYAEKQIDPVYGTRLANFIKVYQKMKYSNHALNQNEEKIIREQHPAFVRQVRKQIPFSKRSKHFINTGTALDFFTQPNTLGTGKKQ